MANALVELRDTINEALRMHQLNLELLEYLDVALKWLRENDIPIPSREKFVVLLSKTDALLKEIYSSSILQLQKRSDDFLQRDRTDEELTE